MAENWFETVCGVFKIMVYNIVLKVSLLFFYGVNGKQAFVGKV